MKAIKFSPLFFVAIIIVFLTKNIFSFAIMYLTLVIHELVHIFFMCKNKIAVEKIVVEPFGISILAQNLKNDNNASCLIFLSAPLFNVILAIGLYFYSMYTKQTYFSYFIVTNLTLGIFNLIPCLPFDGGKAVSFLLSKRYGSVLAGKITNAISGFISLILIVFGIYILYITNFNFSIFVIGIFILYNSIVEKKLITNKVISHISNMCSRGELENIIPISYIAVSENYYAHKLLKEFCDNRYYIVNIIKKGKVVKTLTETEIAEKLVTSNMNLRLKDY